MEQKNLNHEKEKIFEKSEQKGILEIKEAIEPARESDKKEIYEEIRKRQGAVKTISQLDEETEGEAREMKMYSFEKQIDLLLRIVPEKGINYVIKVAEKIGPHVLDKIHDGLILLIKQGKIKI